METLVGLFLIFLLAVALFKALVWTVKAGLFVLFLPIKLLVGFLALLFMCLFLPLAVFPGFLVLLVLLAPFLLIAFGLYLLLR